MLPAISPAAREYEAFGNLIPNSPTGTWPGRWGYQGQSWMEIFSGNGSQRYFLTPTRIADPLTGRFLAKDMIRRPGQNLYVYAENQPLNLVDPQGLEGVKVTFNNCDQGPFLFDPGKKPASLTYFTHTTKAQLRDAIDTACNTYKKALKKLESGDFSGTDDATQKFLGSTITIFSTVAASGGRGGGSGTTTVKQAISEYLKPLYKAMVSKCDSGITVDCDLCGKTPAYVRKTKALTAGIAMNWDFVVSSDPFSIWPEPDEADNLKKWLDILGGALGGYSGNPESHFMSAGSLNVNFSTVISPSQFWSTAGALAR